MGFHFTSRNRSNDSNLCIYISFSLIIYIVQHCTSILPIYILRIHYFYNHHLLYNQSLQTNTILYCNKRQRVGFPRMNAPVFVLFYRTLKYGIDVLTMVVNEQLKPTLYA